MITFEQFLNESQLYSAENKDLLNSFKAFIDDYVKYFNWLNDNWSFEAVSFIKNKIEKDQESGWNRRYPRIRISALEQLQKDLIGDSIGEFQTNILKKNNIYRKIQYISRRELNFIIQDLLEFQTKIFHYKNSNKEIVASFEILNQDYVRYANVFSKTVMINWKVLSSPHIKIVLLHEFEHVLNYYNELVSLHKTNYKKRYKKKLFKRYNTNLFQSHEKNKRYYHDNKLRWEQDPIITQLIYFFETNFTKDQLRTLLVMPPEKLIYKLKEHFGTSPDELSDLLLLTLQNWARKPNLYKNLMRRIYKAVFDV